MLQEIKTAEFLLRIISSVMQTTVKILDREACMWVSCLHHVPRWSYYEDARIMGECAGFPVGSGLPHLFYRGNFPYFRASNFLFHVSSSESRHCHSWSDSFLA